ncbi:MAG: hypothetical protein H6622_03755 [Halobacteriovoraceae bacterium]|nr:hypothetical protein [Halobacteriovoraceae bacterium]
MKKLLNKNQIAFAERLTDIRDFTSNGLKDLSKVDSDFFGLFNKIIFTTELTDFNASNFYLINLVENTFFILESIDELEKNKTLSSEERSECEDELFHFWQNTELAEGLFELIEDGQNLLQISIEFVQILKNQILSFYFTKISKEGLDGKFDLIYNLISELGENEKTIYLKQGHFVTLDETPETLPSVCIKQIDYRNNLFTYSSGDHEIVVEIKQIPQTNVFSGFEFRANASEDKDTASKTINRIKNALNDINILDHSLYESLQSCTKIFVSTDAADIVSFSQQELPFVSTINFYTRDNLDLLDDLLHENGHHFLNYHLNIEELIDEDDEKIFYSPWRKSLRPIRGIFHAYLTFAWAHRLFSSILISNNSIDLPQNLYQKAKRRYLEENYMLELCYKELMRSAQLDKILSPGIKFLKECENTIQQLNLKISIKEDSLDELNLEKYQIFKKEQDKLYSELV